MTKYLPNDYILLISLGFVLVLFSLNEADTDLFGHLMYGENILQSGSLPALNSYSYTNPDYPWVNHKWLSSLIFASIYRFSGGSGILIFKISIFLLTKNANCQAHFPTSMRFLTPINSRNLLPEKIARSMGLQRNTRLTGKDQLRRRTKRRYWPPRARLACGSR